MNNDMEREEVLLVDAKESILLRFYERAGSVHN